MEQSDMQRLIDAYVIHHEELAAMAIALTKNLHTAKDILQELALSLLEREFLAEEVRSPLPYLRRMLKNVYYNRCILERREYSVDPENMHHLRESKTRFYSMEYGQLMAELRANLKRFSRETQDAFLAHYVDGFSINELAQQLGTTPNALSQQFKRIRRRLSKMDPVLWMVLMLGLRR